MTYLTVPAYIDPMAGSLVLQSIVAGVIGVLVMFRSYFRRALALVTFRKPGQDKAGS